jgi:hypothetical protein
MCWKFGLSHALVVLPLLCGGCARRQATQQAAQGGAGEPPSLAAHVNRGKERLRDQNDLQELYRFYELYRTDIGKPPASVDEMNEYIKRDAPKLARTLSEGTYVVAWGATPAPTQVLAYEKKEDINHNQLVLLGDGSVHLMPATELYTRLGSP